MISRRVAFVATIVCLLVGLWGVGLYAQQRIDRCAAVPLFAENLLANPTLAPGDAPGMPAGYERGAVGVELRGPAIGGGEGFDLDGDGRSIQLIGIANYLQLPPVAVKPGANYCFLGYALTDSLLGSATRLQVQFRWSDNAGNALANHASLWQPVVLWQADAPPAGWSPIAASFQAPPNAASLAIRLHPASDDRVYLDVFAVREGGEPPADVNPLDSAGAAACCVPTVRPWPDRRAAAVSFTFDWETTMGGLIHSRSVDDPNADGDPIERGLRMRAGITSTLALFAPYNVRATYFATGYNFLLGNPERRRFMGDPTFAWASPANRWRSERWTTTPWFADDPYGTLASDPAWYFGDLIEPLQQGGHEIQSHTFSHFYGGLVDAATWQLDLAAWNSTAAERDVRPATALAFPWSSSSGMSDANWNTLEAAGITAVTRLSDQAQYNLFPADAQGIIAQPHCQPLPGHLAILACPDFYLTERSAQLALQQVDRVLAEGGMIDLWAHTEEVVTPAQLAAWEQVVRYTAENPNVWVAPFSEIAAWQQAVREVRVEQVTDKETGGQGDKETRPLTYRVSNMSGISLPGLTLQIPAGVTEVAINGDVVSAALYKENSIVLDLLAGGSAEVTLWPAQ
jgi:peptidoglycan/xylan/chitin deacetylase (PgdA/CDA1 family)